METEVSLPCSKEPATGLYPEPDAATCQDGYPSKVKLKLLLKYFTIILIYIQVEMLLCLSIMP